MYFAKGREINLQMSRQRRCLRTFRPHVRLGRGPHIGTKVAGILIYTVSQSALGDERRFWALDGDLWKAAKLVITYQPK